MGALLRALRTRGEEHPEDPGLTSCPVVSHDRMTAACTELRRRGHAVRRVSIGGAETGWALGGTTLRAVAPADPEEDVVVREVAAPSAVPLARAALTRFAEHAGATERVRSSLALAVTEACSNVVLHAYVGAPSPGLLEVRVQVVEDVLLVVVEDHGRGMVPRDDSPGLGFGLALIAQLADAFEILDGEERPGVVLRMQFSLAG
jgi:serine/threonine-protein kinase RsbW